MRVAVLGLGHMGAPIAERLEQAGHDLCVWNRSPAAAEVFEERGVTKLARPGDAWEHADVVITMLADDEAVRAVTLGEGGVIAAGGANASAGGGTNAGDPSADRPRVRTLIDMSTISATTSAEIATAAEQHGISYLRAPVTGNPSVVVAGNLGIIVSGPREVYEPLAPTLRDIGPNVFHVGSGEQARIVKLALNLMLGGTTQLLAEALVLAERNGIERADMLDVISGSAIASPYVKYKREMLLSGDYTSTFTVRLLQKDLGLALAAGHDAAVPLPVTALVQQLAEACIATGMGDLDLAALVPHLQQQAGVQVDL